MRGKAVFDRRPYGIVGSADREVNVLYADADVARCIVKHFAEHVGEKAQKKADVRKPKRAFLPFFCFASRTPFGRAGAPCPFF